MHSPLYIFPHVCLSFFFCSFVCFYYCCTDFWVLRLHKIPWRNVILTVSLIYFISWSLTGHPLTSCHYPDCVIPVLCIVIILFLLMWFPYTGSYLLVNSSEHAAGKRAQLLFQPLSENDTHCLQFSYILHSRDARGPGSLRAYVRVNGGPLGTAVWEVSGPRGKQWQQSELAVSTFWPSEYQVTVMYWLSNAVFEGIGCDYYVTALIRSYLITSNNLKTSLS